MVPRTRDLHHVIVRDRASQTLRLGVLDLGKRLRSRSLRTAILLGGAIGWILTMFGAFGDSAIVLGLGLGLAGGAWTVATKVALESRRGVNSLEQHTRRLEASHTDVSAHLAAVERSRRGHQETVDAQLRDVTATNDRIAAEQSRLFKEKIGPVERQVALLTDALAESSASLKDAIARLNARLPTRVTAEQLAGLTTTDVASPLLSIAIPSFNRSDKFAECLASVEREVLTHGEGVVEVCITDDASTDLDTLETAVQFAETFPFASLRVNPTNLGLERNLVTSCEPCRGRYVLILGNDDLLVADALGVVLRDLREDDLQVRLYEKTRIDQDGQVIEPRPGSTPIAIPPGETHRFTSILDASRRQGLLSTFGFISQVVVAREPFMAVDGDAYLDLTMYPQVFRYAEAFASATVMYRNEPIVFHRSPRQGQKLAESLGRPEQRFMSGGTTKAVRYFGRTYAAALQRLIDRGVLAYGDLVDMPEALMTNALLVRWIESNTKLPGADEVPFPVNVVEDSERLFVGVRLARMRKEQQGRESSRD